MCFATWLPNTYKVLQHAGRRLDGPRASFSGNVCLAPPLASNLLSDTWFQNRPGLYRGGTPNFRSAGSSQVSLCTLSLRAAQVVAAAFGLAILINELQLGTAMGSVVVVSFARVRRIRVPSASFLARGRRPGLRVLRLPLYTSPRVSHQALARAGRAASVFSAATASRRRFLRQPHLALCVWRRLVVSLQLHAVRAAVVQSRV